MVWQEFEKKSWGRGNLVHPKWGTLVHWWGMLVQCTNVPHCLYQPAPIALHLQ